MGMGDATTSSTAEGTMVTDMATTTKVEDQLQLLLLLEGVQLLQQLLLAKHNTSENPIVLQLLMLVGRLPA